MYVGSSQSQRSIGVSPAHYVDNMNNTSHLLCFDWTRHSPVSCTQYVVLLAELTCSLLPGHTAHSHQGALV